MARAATTSDVFNAIAERRRREIIGLLDDGREWAVNDVAIELRGRRHKCPACIQETLVAISLL